MIRALETVAAGAFTQEEIIDRVTLDLEGRRKRRQMLTAAGGTQFLADLPAVPSLKDGDGFCLEGGQVIEVMAADEALIEVSVADPAAMPLIAWHLGNRHLPVQFVDGVIRLRADHVIEDMLHRLGAETSSIKAPFDPEGGAYGHGHTHSHD